MKVGFSLNTNQNDAEPGKHKFFIRLANEMKKRGIKIDNKKPDVYIRLAGSDVCKYAKLNILRLDNVVLDINKDKKDRNRKALKCIKRSDAIIYQSNFSKELYNKFLGVKDTKEFAIISNGASPDEFLPRNPKNYFLANCKWRPCKRLKDIVKSYLRALDMGLNADLIITGKVKSKDRIKNSRIKYLPWQHKEQIRELLSGAIASLHFTWLDCCPNSAIESIVSGCPVIYTKSGGLPQLNQDYGIGIKDKEWDFKPFDINCPPHVDRKQASLAMLKMKEKNISLKTRDDLYIDKVCNKYIGFFEKLLERQ